MVTANFLHGIEIKHEIPYFAYFYIYISIYKTASNVEKLFKYITFFF